MAATTLTAMPSVIYAGDSFAVSISSDYQAPTYTLTCSMRAPGGTAIDFDSTADGAAHLLAQTADQTITWAAAIYLAVLRASNGTDKLTVWEGKIEVKPDLSTQVGDFDTRTHAQICLDAINSVLEGKATRDAISTTIAGQSITRMSFDELLRAKAFYESLVAQEEAQRMANAGKTKGNQILTRFNAPL